MAIPDRHKKPLRKNLDRNNGEVWRTLKVLPLPAEMNPGSLEHGQHSNTLGSAHCSGVSCHEDNKPSMLWEEHTLMSNLNPSSVAELVTALERGSSAREGNLPQTPWAPESAFPCAQATHRPPVWRGWKDSIPPAHPHHITSPGHQVPPPLKVQ